MIKTNKYKDLVNFCKSLYNKKQSGQYLIKYTDKELVISENNKDILQYTFECQEIANFISNWLPDGTTVYVSEVNHYQFLLNADVLDLLLSVEYLNSKHIPINNSFKIKSKSGKLRDIVAPNNITKPALKNINKIFQAAYDGRNSDFQVAYKVGKNIKNNAIPHKDNQYIFKIDLHHFFPSCKRKYVEKYVQFLFQNVPNSEYIKNKFLDVILYDDALYIGNPVSGTLANVIISKPVLYLRNMCKKIDMTFTVYADDMTFSSNKFIVKDFIINMFNTAFIMYNMENDFTLTADKCYGLSKGNRAITGVVLNHNNEVTCHRYLYNKIRLTLHHLNHDDTSHYNHQKLQGQIAFCTMIDDSQKMTNLLTKYKNTVLKYKLVTLEKLNSLGIK